jgi:hypothetical protein
MNQDMVKERLQKLHESTANYNVIFSGKKSKKVNGLYKWGPETEAPEIIIHNRNFLREDGSQNEATLMYTAIHELTHHVLITEMGQKSAHAHSQLFWAAFHDLVDKAETASIYTPEIDADTQKIIDEARDISKQIAELHRQLGRVLLRAQKVCREKGLRYEDVIERRAQISQSTMKSSVAAYEMGDQDVGVDIQIEAVKQRNEYKRNAIIAAGHEGKSVIQAKKSTSPARSVDAEDETAILAREKRRIERTIESLSRRLQEIEQQLITREESGEEKINGKTS